MANPSIFVSGIRAKYSIDPRSKEGTRRTIYIYNIYIYITYININYKLMFCVQEYQLLGLIQVAILLQTNQELTN